MRTSEQREALIEGDPIELYELLEVAEQKVREQRIWLNNQYAFQEAVEAALLELTS